MPYPLGLLGGPQAPPPPTVGGAAYHESLTQPGERFTDMRQAGGAPFTAAGLGTAAMNAVGALRGAITPGGLIGLGMDATGTRPSGLLGGMFGHAIQTVPGYFGVPHKPPGTYSTFAEYQADYHKAAQQAKTKTAEGYKGSSFGGGTGNQSVAGGRSTGGLAVGNDGRIAGGI